MTRPLMFLISLLIGLVLGTSSAHAAPVPTWSFETESIVVGATSSIEIFGRISNDLSADEVLLVGQISPSGGSGAPSEGFPLEGFYDVALGTTNFFIPVEVAPGTSLRFQWAILVPRISPVPVGIYGPGEASIKIGNLSFPNPIASDNLFVIMVVPEPSAVLLFGIGLTGLALLRRWRT